MDLKNKIAVMQAFDDGKEIEWKGKNSITWKVTNLPSWDWSMFDYRVKKTPVTIDVVVYQYDRGPARVIQKSAYAGDAGVGEAWRYHKLHETTIILPDHIELLK